MPIKDKEESGYAPTIPFNQVDNLSGKPQPLVATPSALEVADAALRKENYITRFAYGERNPYAGQKPDPTYSAFNGDKIKGYEDYANWFSECNSDKEVEWVKRIADQDKAHEETLRRAGGWGTAARIVAGAITPDIAIGGVGIAAKGFKGAEMANVAMNAAGAGMISGTLYGTGQNVGNTSRDGLDIVKDAAMFSTAGALLSPAFHTVSSAFGSKAARTVTPAPAVPPVHVPDPAVIQSTAQSIKNYTQQVSAHLASDAPLLADQQAERLAAEIDGMHYDSNAAASSSSQVAPGHTPPAPSTPYVVPALGDMDLAGAFGMEKLGFGQAGVALANSRFVEAKIAAQKLFREMRWRKGNLDGTYTTLQSAESEIERLGHGAVGQGLEHQNATYKEYLKNYDTPQTLAYVRQKFGKDKMNFSEFDNEVGVAMSNADRHAIGEVEKVAQHGRTLIDSLASEAQRLGLLDTSGNLKGTALSYFGRSYDKEAIVAKSSAFKQTIVNEFQRMNPTWTQQQLKDAGDKVFDHIISGNSNKLTNIRTIHIDTNGNIVPLGSRTKTGVAMERKLEIDDNVLEPFLDKSYSQFLRRYSNTVGTDVALTKIIGDSTGDSLLTSLRAEAAHELEKIDAKLIPEAEKELERVQLNADLKKAEYHLKNGVALLNGTYKRHDNPALNATNIARNLTMFNNITMMGGASLSSIGDMTRSILVYGFGPFIQHAFPAIRQAIGDIFKLPSIKDPMYNKIVEMNRRIGIGMEATLNMRNTQIADIIDRDVTRKAGVIDKSMEYLNDKMFRWNGLALLTDWQKDLAGVLSNDEFIRSIRAEVAGTASERELANLRRFGIDSNMSQRIAAEFDHGVAQGTNIIKDNFHFTDTKAWADTEAADTLERALVTATHSIVYNPSAGAKVVAGNLPKEVESVLTQFMSFNWGSHIQHTVPMLQKMDMATWSYIMASLVVGDIVYETKQLTNFANGKERPERTWQEHLYDTLDQSSLLSLPYQINGIASGVSRQLDAKSYLGISDHSPTLSATNFNIGSIAGPTGRQITNAFTIGSDVMNDTVDKRTLAKAAQLAPMNQLFYIKWLRDMGIDQAQDMLDVPDKATVTITKRK